MEISDTQLNRKGMQEKYMQQNPIFLQKQYQYTYMNTCKYTNMYVDTHIYEHTNVCALIYTHI